MWNKIAELIKKHRDILAYIFFGGLTTLVNWLTYFPCLNWLGLDVGISNAVAWVVSVLFAFVTNKPFVFHSHDWSPRTALPELWKFVGTRLGSFAVEEFFMIATVNMLGWNGNLMKLIVSVVVVIINYVGSKLLVFRKREM